MGAGRSWNYGENQVMKKYTFLKFVLVEEAISFL